MSEEGEMTKIKFCGLTRPVDIEYANLLRPDYVGFVLTKSRRQISTAMAREMRRQLDPRIPAVGVFAGEDPDLMLYYADMEIIQAIQLHGIGTDGTQLNGARTEGVQVRGSRLLGPKDAQEASVETLIQYLKERTQVPVIKAVSFPKRTESSADDTCNIASEPQVNSEIQRQLETGADYLLFDQGRGGSGQVFDWDLIPEKTAKPFFLAGGIGPDNARAAIERFHPYCLDCSSGLETGGYKDFEKMKRMINLVRGYRNG